MKNRIKKLLDEQEVLFQTREMGKMAIDEFHDKNAKFLFALGKELNPVIVKEEPHYMPYEFVRLTERCQKQEADGVVLEGGLGKKYYYPKTQIDNWDSL